jgi:hypothetical protein
MFREEWMFLDIICTSSSQSARRITLKEASHETFRILRQFWREDKGVGENSLIHHVHILIVEWWEPGLYTVSYWHCKKPDHTHTIIS